MLLEKKNVHTHLLVRDVLERRLVGSEVECCLITSYSLYQPHVLLSWRSLAAPLPPATSLLLTLSACLHPKMLTLCHPCDIVHASYVLSFLILKNTFKMSTITPFCKETHKDLVACLKSYTQKVTRQRSVLFNLAHAPILCPRALYFLPEDSPKVTVKWITEYSIWCFCKGTGNYINDFFKYLDYCCMWA